jgi:Zn-dependent M32 family carboxypeptidase
LTSNIDSVYKELLSKTKDAVVLQTAEGIIHWDMETFAAERS